MKRAYIRPIFYKETPGVLPYGYALTRCSGPCLQDSDIIAHFPADATGKEIKESAAEFYGVTAEWSDNLEIEGEAKCPRPQIAWPASSGHLPSLPKHIWIDREPEWSRQRRKQTTSGMPF